MMERIIIACATDSNFIVHTAAMICSLVEHTNSKIDIYIMYSEPIVENIKSLEKTFNNLLIKLVRVDQSKFKNYKLSNRINEVSYYRLLLGNIIPEEINKVIYLDSDLIVFDDIKKLWDIDLYNKIVGAVPDVGQHTRYVSSNRAIALYKELNIPEHSLYFNAGVLIINLERWRNEKIADVINDYLQKNKEYVNFHDQDGLNAILWNKWYRIDYSWNVITDFFEDCGFCIEEIGLNKYRKITNCPKIVHFTSRHKPWHDKNEHMYKKIYMMYEERARKALKDNDYSMS